MTERPPRPEVSAFLHDRASALDREASPVTADEAARRTIVDASKPRRQWPAASRPGKMRTSPRSALAAAAVVALIVGALAGFAVGRGSAPKDATVATAGAPSASDSAAQNATTTVPSQVWASGSVVAGSGGFNGATWTRLFDRTTSENVAVHAFQQGQSSVSPPACPADSFCPPPECYAGSLTVEAANKGAAGVFGVPTYALHEVVAVAAPVKLGEIEGSPSFGWILNTGPQVANVEARWGDGFADSMAPVQGWAVVIHDDTRTDATITATDGSGAVLTRLTPMRSSYTQPPAECMPPPPAPPLLPPAGAEQPDDPAAARQAITDAYQTVFAHGSDPATNAQYIEDPDSIQQAAETTKSNFPQAVDTVTVNVGDIVFTSKTEAALYFELNYQGGAEFGQQVGHAKLIDGTWKIAHDTMCMVLGWGGGQCEGGSGFSPGAPPATPLTTVVNN
jgi:hypothetical protein